MINRELRQEFCRVIACLSCIQRRMGKILYRNFLLRNKRIYQIKLNFGLKRYDAFEKRFLIVLREMIGLGKVKKMRNLLFKAIEHVNAITFGAVFSLQKPVFCQLIASAKYIKGVN